mmetsp:Transcript_3826/g.24243  ORF Transcript_3826/g.24243 Transcript_3826/m.24243 type:complete len:105 (+) Transcript_3826:1353-1667(+)
MCHPGALYHAAVFTKWPISCILTFCQAGETLAWSDIGLAIEMMQGSAVYFLCLVFLQRQEWMPVHAIGSAASHSSNVSAHCRAECWEPMLFVLLFDIRGRKQSR